VNGLGYIGKCGIWIRNYAKFEDKVENEGNMLILMEFEVCDNYRRLPTLMHAFSQTIAHCRLNIQDPGLPGTVF